MFENHSKVSFIDFRGLYDRGNRRMVPPTHARVADNCVFSRGKVKVRNGFKYDDSLWQSFGWFFNLVNVFEYYNQATDKYEWLVSSDAGSVYQVKNPSNTITGPLLTIPGWNGYFSAAQIGNRVYILPYTAVSQNLFVWTVDATFARSAGGTAPATAPTITQGGAGSGNIEPGYHTVAIAFETDTGFITAPSPVGSFNNVFPNGVAVTLTNIPLGPGGTAARSAAPR